MRLGKRVLYYCHLGLSKLADQAIVLPRELLYAELFFQSYSCCASFPHLWESICIVASSYYFSFGKTAGEKPNSKMQITFMGFIARPARLVEHFSVSLRYSLGLNLHHSSCHVSYLSLSQDGTPKSGINHCACINPLLLVEHST